MIPTSEQDIDLDEAIHWLTKHTTFPTFDEFRKNPDKWRLRPEELFESADASTQTFRRQLKDQKYYWKDQFDCGDSLEKVERIAKEEGFTIGDLEMQPKARPKNGTSQDDMEIVIHFWPKVEFKAMGGIVANE